MLGVPTLCSSELRDRYNDQFVAINEIVEADRKEDEATNKVLIVCNPPSPTLTVYDSRTQIKKR